MKRASGLVATILFAGVIAGSLFAWSQRQAIYDWARLRDYKPPAEIARLATETTMSDAARRLFYVHRPELNDRSVFYQNCHEQSEHTIVLGCYVAGVGIYIFNVDDPRLEGVEQVTAAHEMLHAAYDRLSKEEKVRIDRLTGKVFENIHNDRIRKNVESYRARDASVVPNELHSIIATEVRDIPEELETYYKQYFSNRLKIVAFSERYESVLTSRRSKAATLEAEITGARQAIEALEARLKTERESLQRERAAITDNEQAVLYNARVEMYNSGVTRLNAQIRRYNNLIAEYEANALEAQELFKALNSHPEL